MDSTAMTKALVDLMRGCAVHHLNSSDCRPHLIVPGRGRDVPGLLDDAIALRFLPPDVDRKALLPALERIFAKGALAAVRVATHYLTFPPPRGTFPGEQMFCAELWNGV